MSLPLFDPPGPTPADSPDRVRPVRRGVEAAAGDGVADAVLAVLDRERTGPLEPATVVVDVGTSATLLRRELARRHGGLAGVEVLTVSRLVDRLVEGELVDRGLRAASPLEFGAAVRAELRERPGAFGAVADHHTTQQRLVRLAGEVAGIGPTIRDRLAAQDGLAGDAFRVLAGAERRLEGLVTDGARAEWAVDLLAEVPLGSLGPIVLVDPDPRSPGQVRIVETLARRADTWIVVATTGLAAVDGPHRRQTEPWGVAPGAEVTPPVVDRVEVGDPDDEVRWALAELTAWSSSVPWNRMALLYGTTDPSASVIAEQAAVAGIPIGGPGHRTLGASLAGRTLRRLLRLAGEGIDRDGLYHLLESAPITDDVGPIPATRWERIGRQAGVIDADDWADRLDDLARQSDDADDRAEIERLAAFVASLAEALRPPEGEPWTAWASWIGGLTRRFAPLDQRWPSTERAAAESVDRIVDGLARLDAVAPPPTLDDLTATIEGELGGRTIPGNPVGEGVVVAPVGSVAGLGFDVVVVVGVAEGVFPRIGRADSFLPDAVRARSEGRLPPSTAVAEADVRRTALALAGARRAATVVHSRGDLRSRRSRRWPRVLDPLIGASVADDDRRPGTVVASHHELLVATGTPSSRADLGLRHLVAAVDRGTRPESHALAHADPTVGNGLRRALARQRVGFGPATGEVAPGSVDPSEVLLSPTALEDYATCPRRYLLGRVIRLTEDERPDRISEITPRDRGSLVHEVLDRFLRERIEHDEVPPPTVGWGAAAITRLHDLLDAEIDRAARSGRTGGRVQTRLLARKLHREMHRWVASDDAHRAERGATPILTEWAFGFDDDAAVVGEDGAQFRLRGVVDRIDVTDDDGLWVIDYKGGSGSRYTKLDDDPLQSGRRLQLPLYALVAAERLGRTGPARALYWLTEKDALRPMDLGGEVGAELRRIVEAAHAGIAGGLFPARPGEARGWPRLTFDHCAWCDLDPVCPVDRQSEWERVADDPALTPIDVLLGREDDS